MGKATFLSRLCDREQYHPSISLPSAHPSKISRMKAKATLERITSLTVYNRKIMS
jgi:hypothetical protein